MKEFYNKYLNENIKFDKLTIIAITSLIIVISGVFGFVYEFIFYFFNGGMKEFYYRGGNFLPWINIYAIGSVLIILLTYKDRSKPLKVFFKSTIICGILEFIAGYVLYNYFGHFRCWDYNTEILNFGNIGGFICLRSVLFFGVSSLLLIYGILPMVIYLSKKINKTAVGRNRIRRRVYEVLRNNMDSIPKRVDYVFVVFSSDILKIPYKELEKLLGELVTESKVCYNKK